jgi:hypothetical protein
MFYMDCEHVSRSLRHINETAQVENLLAFLAGIAGNRVLTYDTTLHEKVKGILPDLGHRHDLSGVARGHLNTICANQGWG